MKISWKKKETKKRPLPSLSNLPFDQPHSHQHEEEEEEENLNQPTNTNSHSSLSESINTLALSFQDLGNKLALDGKFREALGKWEAALNIMPENAVLHEQKAQVLLEVGDAWSAVKAATRATELEPSWAEAWITLGRAQLNFGEPDSAIESFDRALGLKPDLMEAKDDRHAALQLVKRRKQLHATGLSTNTNRYTVSDN